MGAIFPIFLGNLIVGHAGDAVTLSASMVVSILPAILFSFMPETKGDRLPAKQEARDSLMVDADGYVGPSVVKPKPPSSTSIVSSSSTMVRMPKRNATYSADYSKVLNQAVSDDPDSPR